MLHTAFYILYMLLYMLVLPVSSGFGATDYH